MVAHVLAAAGLTCAAQEALPLLKSTAQVRQLNVEEASRRYPVRIAGVVTYFDRDWRLFFVQDRTSGIYVSPETISLSPKPGDFIEVEGASAAGAFTPVVVPSGASLIDEGRPLPDPVAVALEDLATGRFDCVRVEVSGFVRQATDISGRLLLKVAQGAGSIRVHVFPHRVTDPSKLVGTQVRARGVCGVNADRRRQITALNLWVASEADLDVEQRTAPDVFALPVTSIAAVLSQPASDAARPIHLRGRVKEVSIGGNFVIANDSGTVQVKSDQRSQIASGEAVDLIGFVESNSGKRLVVDAMYRILPAEADPAASPASAPAPSLPVLHQISHIRELPAEEAARRYPVAVEGTISYADPEWNLLFVQDATAGIYVYESTPNAFSDGQKVRVTGVTGAGDFAPIIMEPRIAIIGQGTLPAPHRVKASELTSGSWDSQWIEVRGVVRHATVEFGHATLIVGTASVSFKVIVPRFTGRLPDNLVDAEATVRGVCAVELNARKQVVGTLVYASTLDSVQIDRPAPPDPFASPASPIISVFRFAPPDALQHRLHVRGVVTLVQQEGFFLQDDTAGILIRPASPASVTRGDFVSVAGFLLPEGFSSSLQHSVVKSVGTSFVPEPPPLPASRILEEALDAQWVKTQGLVLDDVQRGGERMLRLESGGLVFEAALSRESVRTAAPASGSNANSPVERERSSTGETSSKAARGRVEHLRRGTRVELTGVAVVEAAASGSARSLRLLLPSPGHITVMARAPWWNSSYALVGLGTLAFLGAAAAVWGATLRRRVRHQTELIRERLEREASLEKRYCDLVENANDIIYTHDLEGNLSAFNRAGEKITGYSIEEATQMNIARLIAPDQLALAREMTARKIAGTPLTTYDLDLITKSGARITVEVSSRPVCANGKVVAVQGIARDITVRKRAEVRTAAFSRLAQRLSVANRREDAARMIADVADSLLGWDAFSIDLYSGAEDKVYSLLNADLIDGKRVEVAPAYVGSTPSPQARRVLQDGAALILRDQSDAMLPGAIAFGDRSRPSASLLFVQLRDGKNVVGFLTVQSYTPNAYTRDDLDTLQSLADLCGGALVRIRAEEALRQSEEKFRQVVEQAADAFFVHTLDGRFVDVNQRACESLGYTRSELLALTAADIELETGAEDWRNQCQRLAPGTALTVQRIHRRKDGATFPVEVRVGRFEAGGRELILALARDITERLNLEAQLRHAHKLESIGRLAAGIAHDFNNILTIIQGYAGLLQMQSGPSSDAVADPVLQISHATQRAANLTRQLLTFSRRHVMKRKPVDLNDVIGHISKLLHRVIGENVDLRFSCAGQLPLIEADPGMVEQIVLNLVVNARDAMPKGGTITITTSVVDIGESYVRKNPEAVLGPHVCLSVRDNGIGMDESTLSRIFEPFFTTKDVGKGTGLGLATVYGIVKQHHGWVQVASRVGQGSTFDIYFPTTSKAVAKSLGEPAPPVDQFRGHGTILLVEDEVPLRCLARKILSGYGYRVLEAATGSEALALWREHAQEIRLLLTDMVMPEGMTGHELAESLRREKPGLKVIYTSGYSPEVLQLEFPLGPGLKFLPKPYRPATLGKMVRDCLEGAG